MADEPKNPIQGSTSKSPLNGGHGYTLSASTTADMLSKIGIPTTASISAAPEKTIIGEIQSAYLSSNTPIQFVDKATKNISNLQMERLRGTVSAPVDKSLTSTFIDAAKAVTYFAAGDFMKPGDKRFSQNVGIALEKSLDKNGKPLEFGDYDIMMASGWHPKGPIKVNGVIKTFDKPIDNILSVFVRNKDGDIEIIEPSQKMTSLTDVGKLWSAVMGDAKTDADKHWQATAGKHVAWQVLPMLASGGTWATLKGGTMLAAKAPQIEKAVELATKVSGAATKVTAPLAATNGVSGLTLMAGELSQGMIISPKAIKDLANGLANVLNHPKGITEDGVRDKLNNALHEYTFNKGPEAKQIYIPSLSQHEQPWDRLREAMQGVIKGQEKSSHPWQEWSPKNISDSNVRTALVEHPGINHAFYSSIDKYLSGKPLTDRDYFVMRVGIMLGPENSAGSAADLNPAGKSGTLKYTAQEKTETLKYVSDQLQTRLLDKAIDNPSTAKKYGMDIDNTLDVLEKKFTPAQIKSFVSNEAKESGAIIEAQQKAEMQRAQAQAMAFSMTH